MPEIKKTRIILISDDKECCCACNFLFKTPLDDYGCRITESILERRNFWIMKNKECLESIGIE